MHIVRRLTVSSAAALAAACLFYRGGLLLLPITVLPIAAHELSHWLALRLMGRRVTKLGIDMRGLCLYVQGQCTPIEQLLAALAGPLGGAVYAWWADRTGIAWMNQSAGLSLLLSAFNLLPVLPLDGGRAFLALGTQLLGEGRAEKLYRPVSRVLLALFILGALLLAAREKGTAPLAAGIWLLLSQNEQEALANAGKIG